MLSLLQPSIIAIGYMVRGGVRRYMPSLLPKLQSSVNAMRRGSHTLEEQDLDGGSVASTWDSVDESLFDSQDVTIQ
jgi:hypothetical protein